MSLLPIVSSSNRTTVFYLRIILNLRVVFSAGSNVAVRAARPRACRVASLRFYSRLRKVGWGSNLPSFPLSSFAGERHATGNRTLLPTMPDSESSQSFTREQSSRFDASGCRRRARICSIAGDTTSRTRPLAIVVRGIECGLCGR